MMDIVIPAEKAGYKVDNRDWTICLPDVLILIWFTEHDRFGRPGRWIAC